MADGLGKDLLIWTNTETGSRGLSGSWVAHTRRGRLAIEMSFSDPDWAARSSAISWVAYWTVHRKGVLSSGTLEFRWSDGRGEDECFDLAQEAAEAAYRGSGGSE